MALNIDSNLANEMTRVRVDPDKMAEITYTKLESWFLTCLEERFQNLEKDEWADYINKRDIDSSSPNYWNVAVYFNETVCETCEEFLDADMIISLRHAILDSVDWKKIVKYHARCIKFIIDQYEDEEYVRDLSAKLALYS